MSQENQQTSRRSLSTRSVLLVVLLVGLGAGGVVYGVASAIAASNAQAAQTTQTNAYPHWYGPRFANRNGTFMSFRAFSTVTNLTVTGFSVVDSNHFSVNLSYGGTGSTPAITVVGLAPGLSGSTTLSAGWSSPTTLTVNMVGSGTLSSTNNCIRALVVPYTA